MRKMIIDYHAIQRYINDNYDKPIYIVYKELKSKKLKNLTNEELILLSYLKLNKRKLGIK